MAGRSWYAASQICAGQKLKDGSWAEVGCGDSGGPLLVQQEGGAGWMQIGVVSWGYGSDYDVYTKVSAFKSWIQACFDGSPACGAAADDDEAR